MLVEGEKALLLDGVPPSLTVRGLVIPILSSMLMSMNLSSLDELDELLDFGALDFLLFPFDDEPGVVISISIDFFPSVADDFSTDVNSGVRNFAIFVRLADPPSEDLLVIDFREASRLRIPRGFVTSLWTGDGVTAAS